MEGLGVQSAQQRGLASVREMEAWKAIRRHADGRSTRFASVVTPWHSVCSRRLR